MISFTFLISGAIGKRKKRKRRRKGKRRKKRKDEDSETEEEFIRPKQKPFGPQDEHFYPTPRQYLFTL